MSTHVVIIADLANTKNDTAVLDVGTDQAPYVQYQVYPSSLPSPKAAFSDSQFATSPDLLGLAASLPALVLAQTVDGQTPPQPVGNPSQAMLRQHKLFMSVPPVETIIGTQFAFPVGDLGLGAFLLIANPPINASDCSVQITPTPTSQPTTLYVPLPGVVAYPLPAAAAGSRVFVFSPNGVALLVQLAVLGHGQEFSMTIIPRLVP
jgi:hypothetical protein